jgi:hypothetical protein
VDGRSGSKRRQFVGMSGRLPETFAHVAPMFVVLKTWPEP